MAEKNPLLNLKILPPYNKVTGEKAYETMFFLTSDSVELFDQVIMSDDAPTWRNAVLPVFDYHEKILHLWKIVEHIHNVRDDDASRLSYERISETFEEYAATFASHRQLYLVIQDIKKGPAFNELTPLQKLVIERLLRDYRLNGAELSQDLRDGVISHRAHLAKLVSRYEGNIQHCNDDYAYYVETEDALAGIPADVTATFRAAAEKEGNPGYKLTLQAPSYVPTMRFADNRGLRQTLYTAYVTRASQIGQSYGHSDYTAGVNENGVYIKQILIMRKKIAGFLGYNTAAEYTLADRMLDTPQKVIDFLRNLAQKARPYAEKEYAELQAFAEESLELDSLEAWDIAYASEKLCQSRFGFSEQDIRPYFQLEKVLDGLFGLVNTLFNIDVRQEDTPDTVLHPSVRFYRIEENGKLLGKFYLDPYARQYKHGGAWMDDAVFRRIRTDGSFQYPIAQLVCNFGEPLDDRPTLLTHDEVLTLFHEFGHTLHLLLSEVDEYPLSGMNGVEWDAVELPSQFMENFGWEWPVIEKISSHVETGEPMPKALFDQLRAAKNFQVGMRMLKQIEYALFDMYLHAEFDPEGQETFQDVLDRTRKEVAVVFPPDFDRFAQSFSHIFAGGYGAGYYAYKWSDILSADAYAAFKEAAKDNPEAILSPELGMKFRKEILAVGSTRPMMESFKAFRGREPAIDAYIESAFGES